MIDLDEARRRAQRVLDGTSGIPLVITGVQAFGDGWVFFYDSKRHQETGNISDLLAGNAPILVDRDTGETHPTGSNGQELWTACPD